MTWRLVSQSFRLLREDLQLMIFPVLSTFGAVALSAPFLLLLFGGRLTTDLEIQWGPWTWLLLFGWYFTASFVTIFFNCALAACVQMRFNGETPTIGAGLQRAI